MQFNKFNSVNSELNRLQANCDSMFKYLIQSKLADVSTVENINLIVGDNQISTGLNRKVVGWFIVDINNDSVIYRVTTTSNLESLFLTLNSSKVCTISLLLF